MISKKDNPFAWSMLVSDVEDAHEHLGRLIKAMATEPEYEEAELRIDLGHVYAHLSRAWRRRRKDVNFREEEWMAASGFPNDIGPVT